MSKNLVKIITICLLAIIVPVAIVVTAICLSNAVTYTLTLDKLGFQEAGSVVLRVNGQEYQDTMKISRNQNVTLSVTTQGYTFDGWYEGKNTEIDETKESLTEAGETTYTFKMTGDKNFTAKGSIIEYTVTYDGAHATPYKYGEELNDGSYAVISAENQKAGHTFVGWTLAEDETVYTKATFGTETEVALVSKTEVVKENITYTVTYDGANATEIPYGGILNDGSYAVGIDAAEGDLFDGWVIEGEDTIYTTAMFGTDVNVALVSTKVNLYDNSYKLVKFEFMPDSSDYKDLDGYDIDSVEYPLDNVITEQGTLTYDFNTLKVMDLIEDVELTTVYKDSAEYEVYALQIRIGVNNYITINDKLDELTAEKVFDKVPGFQDGDTVIIRIVYAAVVNE